MKRSILIGFIILSCFTVIPSFADEQQQKIYLVQVLNQLSAIQSLVLMAQKEQPANTRMQFHYTHYRDTQGQLHNGLLDDIKAIKEGIEQQLNQAVVEPRTVVPIKGDYINPDKGAQNP